VRVETIDHRQRPRLVGEMLHDLCHQFRYHQRDRQGTQDFQARTRPACGKENPSDKGNAKHRQRDRSKQRIDQSEHQRDRRVSREPRLVDLR
jgi:hypothetical protein